MASAVDIDSLVNRFMTQLHAFGAAIDAVSEFGGTSVREVLRRLKQGTDNPEADVETYFHRLKSVDAETYKCAHMIADCSAQYGMTIVMKQGLVENLRKTNSDSEAKNLADFIATSNVGTEIDITNYLDWIDTIDVVAQKPGVFGSEPADKVAEFRRNLAILREATVALIGARNNIRVVLDRIAIAIVERPVTDSSDAALIDTRNG